MPLLLLALFLFFVGVGGGVGVDVIVALALIVIGAVGVWSGWSFSGYIGISSPMKESMDWVRMESSERVLGFLMQVILSLIWDRRPW